MDAGGRANNSNRVWAAPRGDRTSAAEERVPGRGRVLLGRLPPGQVCGEDAKVLAIPAVAPLVGVVGAVGPERHARQVGLHGVHRRVHRLHLRRVVAGAGARVLLPVVREPVVHVKGNARLTNPGGVVAQDLVRVLADAAHLAREALAHRRSADRHGLERARVGTTHVPDRVKVLRVPVLGEQRNAVVKVRRGARPALQVVVLVDLPRQRLKHGRLHKHDRLRVQLAQHARVPAPVRQPELRDKVDPLRVVRCAHEVVWLEDPARLRLPHPVQRPDAPVVPVPVAVEAPAPGADALVLVGREPHRHALRVQLHIARAPRPRQLHLVRMDRLGPAHAEHKALSGRRHGPDLHHAGRRVQVRPANVAGAGLVHAVPAQHALVEQVARIAQRIREHTDGAQVVVLQPVLDVFPVNVAARRKGAATEEERKQRCNCHALVVRVPDHLGQLLGVRPLGRGPVPVEHRGARDVQVARVHAAGGERPERRARAARKAREEVLVRVHHHAEAVCLAATDHSHRVLEELDVVLAGPGVLDRLPGEDIAQVVEAPGAQAPQMHVGTAILEAYTLSHKAGGARLTLLPEGALLLRRLVQRRLVRRREIDAAQNHRAAVAVAEEHVRRT